MPNQRNSARKNVEVVKLDRVSLYYPQGTPIFYDLSYSFFAGGFYFLTGASGAGKTSLLRLIYRGVKATEGIVRVFGRDVSRLSSEELPLFRQKMGLVFQDCRLINHLTAVENVALAMRIVGNPPQRCFSYAKELLHWVGLGDHLNHLPSMLSDGQKQRIGIARAVITRPLLLIADEPTGNVDEAVAYKLMILFEEMNKVGTTVILATHNTGLVKSFSYPVLHLNQGQLLHAEPRDQGV
ncbi:MAG: ATP-binding cassette domain-containing protein [Alphaproteobacteria bacterium]|nr:ATP-binding cassette domain-containing protein [Alphaproteobacteria bacterium]